MNITQGLLPFAKCLNWLEMNISAVGKENTFPLIIFLLFQSLSAYSPSSLPLLSSLFFLFLHPIAFFFPRLMGDPTALFGLRETKVKVDVRRKINIERLCFLDCDVLPSIHPDIYPPILFSIFHRVVHLGIQLVPVISLCIV